MFEERKTVLSAERRGGTASLQESAGLRLPPRVAGSPQRLRGLPAGGQAGTPQLIRKPGQELRQPFQTWGEVRAAALQLAFLCSFSCGGGVKVHYLVGETHM